jgi:prepilin-type N-terminal cleavage/methylation domain-containing protein
MEKIMEKIVDRKGFTVIELLIALSILGLVLSLTISAVNWKDRKATDISTELMGHFTSMELAVSLYHNNTSAYPVSLADANFVPSYLFPPKAPVSFDRAFGNATGGGGYYLGQQTTGIAKGYFLCAHVTGIADSSDAKFIALTMVKEKTPTGKFFYNTGICTTDGSAEAAADIAPASVSPTTDIYLVYWLTRE